MAKSKLVKANDKIAEKVVGGYKKIENGTVGSFNKIADKFVDNFLTKEGESVEDARKRLAKEQKSREEADKKEVAEYSQDQVAIIEQSMQSTKNAIMAARKTAGLA